MAATRADLKRNLRAQLRQQREERFVEHNLLHLLELPEFSRASVIASYHSYGTEPSTHALNEAIITSGKTLLLPRVNADAIEWVQWDGTAATLSKQGNFHEPIGPSFLELEKIDLVLVPALAIDPEG